MFLKTSLALFYIMIHALKKHVSIQSWSVWKFLCACVSVFMTSQKILFLNPSHLKGAPQNLCFRHVSLTLHWQDETDMLFKSRSEHLILFSVREQARAHSSGRGTKDTVVLRLHGWHWVTRTNGKIGYIRKDQPNRIHEPWPKKTRAIHLGLELGWMKDGARWHPLLWC